MSCKRLLSDQDPDYENDLSNDQKRLKVIEKNNKEATVRKIQQIVTTQFGNEVKLKEAEAKDIDNTLYKTLKMLDQLRFCAVTSYYSFERPCETALNKTSGYQPPIHSAVKKYIGKRPRRGVTSSGPNLQSAPAKDSGNDKLITSSLIRPSNVKVERNFKMVSSSVLASPLPAFSSTSLLNMADDSSRGSRFKIKKRIIVGNVSQYIRGDKHEESDMATHKWMVYVRGPKEEPFIETFVKKVCFFLHSSYKPNTSVIVNRHPFQVTRRGWGEFPVRIQLHFHNPRNKHVDIQHMLKLDKTYTGLQTLGSETVVDLTIFNPDLISGDTVERSDAAKAQSSVVPLDIGGISIPADGSGCGLEIPRQSPSKPPLLPHNISECFFPPNVMETVDTSTTQEKSPEFTTIMPRNHFKSHIKQEKLKESDQMVSELFLSSFINDHGAYFNPSTSGAVDCGHGNSTPAVGDSNEDLCNHPTSIIQSVRIKEEPHDEPVDADLDLPNASQSTNSISVVEEFSESVDLINAGHSVTQIKCINETRPTLMPIKQEHAVAASSVNQQKTRSDPSVDGLIKASKPDPTNIKSQDPNVIRNHHFNATGMVNNLPVLIIPSKSQTPSSPSSTVSNVCIKTPCSRLTPSNSINTLRPQSLLVTGEARKPDGQPQASNGVNIQWVDKQGNVYHIPVAMVVKMEPSANASSSSSSLLKPLTKTQTAVGSSANHALNTGFPKAVQAVTLPSSNSVQQSLLINSKVQLIAQINNRSLLAPPNSVSLLTGSQRGKLQSGGAGCTSPAKTMVSCLVKNRLAANSKVQTTCETKESPSLIMDAFETMEGVVRTLVKTFPLFAQNPDRVLHPYCAPSLKDFLSWNVGKRHAAEWQRARAIQKKILQLIPNSSKWNANSVWPIKRLLLWCRHYGYSPVKLVEKDEDCIASNEDVEFANVEQFSTYTESTRLLETLNKELDQYKYPLDELENAEEDDVDIITVDVKPKLKPAFSPEKSATRPMIHIPSTPCGEFIRETVEQIGIKLLPEEACEDTVAPLAEEVLLAAVKQFAEEILSCSFANAFKRNGNKRFHHRFRSVADWDGIISRAGFISPTVELSVL